MKAHRPHYRNADLTFCYIQMRLKCKAGRLRDRQIVNKADKDMCGFSLSGYMRGLFNCSFSCSPGRENSFVIARTTDRRLERTLYAEAGGSALANPDSMHSS